MQSNDTKYFRGILFFIEFLVGNKRMPTSLCTLGWRSSAQIVRVYVCVIVCVYVCVIVCVIVCVYVYSFGVRM